jgi:tRNA 2-thiocytidine biosynthesis protein TtcA
VPESHRHQRVFDAAVAEHVGDVWQRGREDLEHLAVVGVAPAGGGGDGLLAPGARVMVCLSGGKDSWTMLHLLGRLVRTLPFRVELVAVHLDQRQPGYDGAPLVEYLKRSGHRFEVLSEDTYSTVKEHLAAGETPCSTCSRLRRGILYTAAERLGCTAIALGHHREDTLETFLLNLVFTGKLQAMPAKYRTDDGRFDVIRPLVECAEADIAAFAGLEGFPIIPCTLCGSQPDSRRDAMGALLTQLEAVHPRVRESMLAALANVRPTHLLDDPVARTPRNAALPIASGGPAAAVLDGTSKVRLRVVE